MSIGDKKLNIVHFKERVSCPYCPETFPTNLSLCRHVLKEHNWNRDYKDILEEYEIIETHGGVAIAKKVTET
jgi:uncharacterized Zn-finger protein